MEGILKLGLAGCDISPADADPVLYGDFGPRRCSKKLTPIQARAMFLDDGSMRFVIVTLDLRGLEKKNCDAIRQAIRKRCLIDDSAIMLISSHASGVPCTVPCIGHNQTGDDTYIAAVCKKTADMVEQAQNSCSPVAIGTANAMLPHLVYNHRLVTRNYKTVSAWLSVPANEVMEVEGPIDPVLKVMVVRDRSGEIISLLWNFAADIRFDEGDVLSAGLPYLIEKEIAQRMKKNIPCMYLPGCGGNISFSRDLHSTVDALASSIIAVALETSCDGNIALQSLQEQVILPVRDYTQFFSESDIDLKAPALTEKFRKEQEAMKTSGIQAVPVTITILRLGRFVIAGLPGMPFAECGLQIKQVSRHHQTFVVANTNEYAGYIPTRAAFERGGYETWPSRSSPVGSGSGEFLAEQASVMLNSLASTQPVEPAF